MSKMQWVIADQRGEKREVAYETKIEVDVSLERMRIAAIKTKNDWARLDLEGK